LGCAHVPIAKQHAGPAPLPADVAAYYAYPNTPANVTTTLKSEHPRWKEWLVQFPLSIPPGLEPTETTVEFEWYESRKPGRRPAIVFNPILGGDYPLERGMCRYFAANGYHVALIHRKTLKISPEHHIDHLEQLLRQGIVRIRQVVDWMEAQPTVDPKRLGSFGISMGGIAGVMTAAVEPRLRVHVVALAGGSIPDIIATSKDKLLAKPLAKYLAYNHLTQPELAGQLRALVRTDPMRLAPYVDSRRMLMFIARFDHTVGYRHALNLWQALGRPDVVFMPTGHYTSLLYLPILKYQSLRFFRSRL
jgi:dienelactone hydrolase